MKFKISKDLYELICVIITDTIRILFIASLVVVVLKYSLLAIFLFKFILKLSDLMSYYLIKAFRYFISNGGD